MTDTPLYVILKREWFDAFAQGRKTCEWRRYGSRWNEQSCRVGRQVTLALGYTTTRLRGRITSFRVEPAHGPAAELYGEGTPCAVFGVRVLR